MPDQATTTSADQRPTDTPQGDGHPAVALTLLILTLAVAAAALTLVIVNRPEWHVYQWYFVVDLADAFVYGLVGYLLMSRVRHPVAGLVMLCAVGVRSRPSAHSGPSSRSNVPMPPPSRSCSRCRTGRGSRARWR